MTCAWTFLTAGLLGAGDLPAVDFDTQIIPVLTRAGCNAGECHGAAAGRGGFHLSLFGSDPAADHRAIVSELGGRRVNLVRPDESLVLLKSTETITHGGGPRLDLESEGGELLLRWIRAGAPRRPDRRLVRFAVEPADAVLEPGEEVRLRATATFADGPPVDVTRWTVFTPSDPGAVDWDPESGRVRALRRGPVTFTARYLDRVLALWLLVPFGEAPVDHSGAPRRNFIDEEILDLLETLRLPLSPPADDAAFLRRVSLDLTGRLPPPDEARRFVDDRSPRKRERMVDRLLASPEFTEYWTYTLAKLLRVGARGQDRPAAAAFHQWLSEELSRGAAYDRLAEALLTAEGDSHAVGPANFQRVVNDPRQHAEFVGQVFLGVRLGCANCHDHPLDRWTQDDYHGMAALFAGLERGRVVKLGRRSEVTNLRTGEPAVPRLPGTRSLSVSEREDGRRALADWLLEPGNPYFARATVNRLWQALMGRGLVEPVDDLSDTNPPTHPRLLDRLAADFAEHGYDLRHTLRRIAGSAAYARSAQALGTNAADDRFYSRFLARRLEAEVLADAISDVTGLAETYGDEPPGTRAIALVDASLPSESLDVLGRCARDDPCESPQNASGGLAARLHVLNGPLLNDRISSDGGRLRGLLDSGASPAEIVEEFYLRALGRRPTARERRFWDEQLGRAGNARDDVLEDFLWSLLSSREFVTNH